MLITHDDTDAAGCAIQVISAFGKENVRVEYHNHGSLLKRWDKITSINPETNRTFYDDFDLIMVADIAPTIEWAAMIDTMDLRNKLIVLDHHRSAEFLNQYDWAIVREEYEEGRKACGASLVYDYLAGQGLNKIPYFFIDLIREFDTWEWKDKNNLDAKFVANLSTIYGIPRFVDKYVKHFEIPENTINGMENLFNEFDKYTLQIEQLRIQDYLEKKERHIMDYEIEGYKAAVLFAETNHSELGNYIATNHPEYDIVVMFNASVAVSYRTVKDIDLSIIAKKFGGGGHPAASGSPFTNEDKDKLIKNYFNLDAQ
jgi:oligoribonuclease NrnB/cAMP/cGMP phosphodiesterase (DHH superfamily)